MSDLFRMTDGDVLHIIHGPDGQEEVVRGVLVPVPLCSHGYHARHQVWTFQDAKDGRGRVEWWWCEGPETVGEDET